MITAENDMHAATLSPAPTAPRVTLPGPDALAAHIARLDEDGYTVLPGFLDHSTTAALRAHTDALIAAAPGGGPVRDLRHPIAGAIMPTLITQGHLALARALLRAPADCPAADLRLTEQVLIRTDPSPTPGANGWHIDWGFHPRHLAAWPRQTYVQMVHALSTVEAGGGAVMVVPGSHRATAAAAARLAERFDAMDQDAFKAAILADAGVDPARGIEILAQEGDLILFHPMMLHSSSRNTRTVPRHVLFMSFFHASATEFNARINRTGYRDGFPASLRDGLAEPLRALLDR